ncbi:putative reverse transcriptase domain-containing protein [Tanacetum coccineum]
MLGKEVDKYIARFHELAKMVPHMVSTEEKRIDLYIWGLIPEIGMNVTSSNLTSLQAAVGLAYCLTNNVVKSEEAMQNPNVVMNTFLLNGHYISILFDSGADRSFVSLEIRPLLEQKSESLKELYTIVYANGHEYEAREILKDCKPSINDELFDIDLILIELKSFDVVLRMDCLIKVRAKIKYLERECFAFLAYVVEKDQKVKCIQDIPLVRNHPEVFPEDLPGPPPSRKVELQIDLISGAALVAKAP